MKPESDSLCSDDPISEMDVLLPGAHAVALELLAVELGLTTAQLLRRIVHEFLTHARNERTLPLARPERFSISNDGVLQSEVLDHEQHEIDHG